MSPGRGVKIFQYVQEGSFDGFMWQAVETKARGIKSLMRRKQEHRGMADIDPFIIGAAEAKALASGDPLAARAIELEQQVTQRRIAQNAHYKQKEEARTQKGILGRQLGTLQDALPGLEADAKRVKALPADADFAMEIRRQAYDKRKDAGEALEKTLESVGYSPLGKPTEIGEYKGFEVAVVSDDRGYQFVLTHPETQQPYYSPAIDPDDVKASGLVSRLDNVVKNIPERADRTRRNISETQENIRLYDEQLRQQFTGAEELAFLEGQMRVVQARMTGEPKGLQEGDDPEMDVHAEWKPTRSTPTTAVPSAPVEDDPREAPDADAVTLKEAVEAIRSPEAADTPEKVANALDDEIERQERPGAEPIPEPAMSESVPSAPTPEIPDVARATSEEAERRESEPAMPEPETDETAPEPESGLATEDQVQRIEALAGINGSRLANRMARGAETMDREEAQEVIDELTELIQESGNADKIDALGELTTPDSTVADPEPKDAPSMSFEDAAAKFGGKLRENTALQNAIAHSDAQNVSAELDVALEKAAVDLWLEDKEIELFRRFSDDEEFRKNLTEEIRPTLKRAAATEPAAPSDAIAEPPDAPQESGEPSGPREEPATPDDADMPSPEDADSPLSVTWNQEGRGRKRLGTTPIVVLTTHGKYEVRVGGKGGPVIVGKYSSLEEAQQVGVELGEADWGTDSLTPMSGLTYDQRSAVVARVVGKEETAAEMLGRVSGGSVPLTDPDSVMERVAEEQRTGRPEDLVEQDVATISEKLARHRLYQDALEHGDAQAIRIEHSLAFEHAINMMHAGGDYGAPDRLDLGKEHRRKVLERLWEQIPEPKQRPESEPASEVAETPEREETTPPLRVRTTTGSLDYSDFLRLKRNHIAEIDADVATAENIADSRGGQYFFIAQALQEAQDSIDKAQHPDEYAELRALEKAASDKWDAYRIEAEPIKTQRRKEFREQAAKEWAEITGAVAAAPEKPGNLDALKGLTPASSPEPVPAADTAETPEPEAEPKEEKRKPTPQVEPEWSYGLPSFVTAQYRQPEPEEAPDPDLAAATAQVEAAAGDGKITSAEARETADEAAKVLSAAAAETPDGPEPMRAYDSDGEIARLVMEICDDPQEMRRVLARARGSRSDAEREVMEDDGQREVSDEARSAAGKVMNKLSQDTPDPPPDERKARISDVELLRRAADECKRDGRTDDVVEEVEEFLRSEQGAGKYASLTDKLTARRSATRKPRGPRRVSSRARPNAGMRKATVGTPKVVVVRR